MEAKLSRHSQMTIDHDLAMAMEQTTEKLNALIRTVDGIIRKPTADGTTMT